MRKVFSTIKAQACHHSHDSLISDCNILYARPSVAAQHFDNALKIPNKNLSLRARLFVALSCTTLVTTLSLSYAVGQSQPTRKPETISPEARAHIRQAISAVGLILIRNANDSESQQPKPRGSGVVVRSDGLIATNYHVIFDSRSNRLYEDIFFSLAEDGTATEAQRYRLKAALINKEMDLALLKVQSETDDDSTVFPAVEIGDSQSVQLLDDLTIIGFPEKGGPTITISPGVVEGKDRLHNWIKTNARVMHGNSGGAAVTNDGKLIGIPTKVLADTQPIDTNGDGYPDANKVYGKVAFLRPSHLIAEMIAKLGSHASNNALAAPSPVMMDSPQMFSVRGVVRSSAGGKPVAGARVGLVQIGTQSVTPQNLLTWGGTNADGEFTLNKAVPPGKYTLKARAIGYVAYSLDIEVVQTKDQLIIELQPSEKK